MVWLFFDVNQALTDGFAFGYEICVISCKYSAGI